MSYPGQIIILPQNQFGLNLQLPSVKFLQCQNVLRTSLKSLQNDAIISLRKNTSNSMNLQYDSYKNTKHVLQVVRLEHKEKLKSQLPSLGFITSFLLDHSLETLNSLWSSTQSKLPKNISISLYSTSKTLKLIARISTNGNSHRRPTVLFACILSLFFMLYQAVSHILKMAATLGDITQLYIL